jgi:hypothetical protein
MNVNHVVKPESLTAVKGLQATVPTMVKLNKVALNEYVKFKLNERLDGTREAAEFARSLHLTPAYISMLRAGKSSVGDSEEVFAGWLAKGSVEKLREISNDWWARQPGSAAPPARRVEYEDRYPNLKIAASFARADGFSEEAIDDVRRRAGKGADLTPRQWLSKIESAEADLRRGASLPGTPLPKDVDEEMRPGPHRLKKKG